MVPVIKVCRLVLGLAILTVTSTDTADLPTDLKTRNLTMKGAHPVKNDEYFCTSYSVPDNEDSYIVKFEALADASTAHHILVFGCMDPYSTNDYWKCGQTCASQSQILFAWAQNAPPLQLPKDVGRHIGAAAGVRHFVVQIHYSHALNAADFTSGVRIYTTQQRQKFVAGIYLLMSYDVTIPANTSKVHADISCLFDWRNSIIHPFGFRTHAHGLGTVISGYRLRDGKYTLIGKGNPQWPQAFYPVEQEIDIQEGDLLGARCTFSSVGRYRETRIGATSADEMCNFYIMYYLDAANEYSRGDESCADMNVPFDFPANSDVELPRNPALEHAAHHHHHGMAASGDTGEQRNNYTTALPTHKVKPNILVDEDTGNDAEEIDSVLSGDLGMTFISEVFPQTAGETFGQIGGLAMDSDGDLYIFHRGDRVWNSMSFNDSDVYQLTDLPITADAVVILDRDANFKRSFGKESYFLPHGLSVDAAGNMWLTDVALHQVFRVPRGADTPDLTLGTRFLPGQDQHHFCKPTDVAVMSTGEFFVSDGYCNSRIMKFNKNGDFIQQWGTSSPRGVFAPAPGTFKLPHGLALAEDKQLLCVADRENGRIQCFDLQGNFIRQMNPTAFGTKLYAVEYCSQHGGILFAVNGPGNTADDETVQGFTLDINTGNLLSEWNLPKTTSQGKVVNGFTHPHDVTVDSERHIVYVGELNPAKVWQFQMTKSLSNFVKSPEKKDGTGGKHNGIAVASSANFVKSPEKKDGTGGKHNGIPVASSDHDDTPDSYSTSLIVGVLLIVPVVLLVVITILVRLYHQGRLGGWRSRGKAKKFSLGDLLHSHKGFDRLSTEDDDHDLENAMEDSDNEEFNITKNMKA